MTIEELKVIITAQTAGLNREVSAARRQISGMQQQAVQAQGKVSSAFAGMKKAAIAAGVALAVKKIATEFTDLSVEAIKIESQIDNLTRTMGASKAGFMGLGTGHRVSVRDIGGRRRQIRQRLQQPHFRICQRHSRLHHLHQAAH